MLTFIVVDAGRVQLIIELELLSSRRMSMQLLLHVTRESGSEAVLLHNHADVNFNNSWGKFS